MRVLGLRPTIWAIYGVLTAGVLAWLLPLVTLFMTSIRPLKEIREGWWKLGGASFTFDNYVEAWDKGISDFIVNSFIITGFATALPLLVGSLAAYAFAKLRFRFREITYFALITTMIVPIQLILIPMLPWLKDFLFLNRLNLSTGAWQPYLGIVLVHTAFGLGWTVFLLTNFFAEVPDELLEAARVDGTSHFGIYWRIIMPLSLPAIVSYVTIQFLWVWNDLLLALTLLARDFQPITAGLAELQSPVSPQPDLISAASIIAILPPMLLFAVLNRYYVRGLFSGAVKG